MLIPLLVFSSLQASLGVNLDIPKQPDFIVEYVGKCPSVGYFFKQGLSETVTSGSCYICFCREHQRAICWKRENLRCDDDRWLEKRHSLAPGDVNTAGMIPQQLELAAKPKGYEKILVQQAKLRKNGTSLLDMFLTEDSHETFLKGIVASEEEEEPKNPDTFEEAISDLGGYDNLEKEIEFTPQLHEETEKEAEFLEKALYALNYTKVSQGDEYSHQKLTGDTVPLLSVNAMPFVSFAKSSDKNPEQNLLMRRKRSARSTDELKKNMTTMIPKVNKNLNAAKALPKNISKMKNRGSNPQQKNKLTTSKPAKMAYQSSKSKETNKPKAPKSPSTKENKKVSEKSQRRNQMTTSKTEANKIFNSTKAKSEKITSSRNYNKEQDKHKSKSEKNLLRSGNQSKDKPSQRSQMKTWKSRANKQTYSTKAPYTIKKRQNNKLSHILKQSNETATSKTKSKQISNGNKAPHNKSPAMSTHNKEMSKNKLNRKSENFNKSQNETKTNQRDKK